MQFLGSYWILEDKKGAVIDLEKNESCEEPVGKIGIYRRKIRDYSTLKIESILNMTIRSYT